MLPVPLGMVDLGPVRRGGAARLGAASLQGVEGQALAGAGGAPPAPVVEPDLAGVVEQRQVGVGAGGGHPDQGGDRQPAAAAGVGHPGRGGQLGQRGGGHDRHRQPVVPAQGSRGQHRPADRLQRVVVTLGGAAGVGVDLGLRGAPAQARGVVVGVGVSGCGQLRPQRIEGGPQRRGEPPGQPAHPVQALRTQAQAALAGVLALVVQGAVGVEVAQQLAGHRAQAFGGQPAGQPGQLGLGGRRGAGVDLGGQRGHEVPDQRDVLGADLAATLGGRGARQRRLHRLAGQRAPGP